MTSTYEDNIFESFPIKVHVRRNSKMVCIFVEWDIKIFAKIDFRKTIKFNCLVGRKFREFAQVCIFVSVSYLKLLKDNIKRLK